MLQGKSSWSWELWRLYPLLPLVLLLTHADSALYGQGWMGGQSVVAKRKRKPGAQSCWGGPGRGQQLVTDEEIWELSLSFQPHTGEEAERVSGRGNTLCKRLELLWGGLRRLSACLVAQTLPAVQDSWL